MAKTPLERKFTQVGELVYISPASGAVGPTGASGADVKGPDVVVIFGWMNAQLPHLYKYTEGHHALFPHANQILVRSTPAITAAIFLGRRRRVEEMLRPAIKALRDYGTTSFHDPSTRVLVHTFSNGGCLNLAHVVRTLAAQSPDAAHNSDTPSNSAFIFDSSPGLPSILKNARAVTAGIPSPFIRRISYILGSVVSAFHLAFTYLVSFLLRRPHIWTRMRADLVDPALVPLSAPRLYVYSTKDEMVGWRDVEKHVKAAREKGVKRVLVKKDEKAGHVNHLKVDAVGYWAAVRKLWTEQ